MNHQAKKISDVGFAIFFVLFISLPLAAQLFGFSPPPVTSEKRSLEDKPPALPETIAELTAYPERFDEYYHDHFGFRSWFLTLYARLEYFVLNNSPHRSVIIGKDGWLFYNASGEISGNPIADARKSRPLPQDKLDKLIGRLIDNGERLKEQNIRYLFVVIPNKSTVYQNYLPDAYYSVGLGSPIDQIIDRLKEDGRVSYLDLRETMKDAAKLHRAYHKTDTHWNSWGSYCGYNAIATRLSEWFPELQPLPGDQFVIKESSIKYGRDLAQMMNLNDYIREANIEAVPQFPLTATVDIPPEDMRGDVAMTVYTERTNSTLPRALIFHDSFTESLRPLLSEHFHRVMYKRELHIDFDLVDHERPNVVLHIVCERYLRPLAKSK